MNDASPLTPAEFDAAWYLETYPDVALTGLSPQDHFERFGRRMGRARSAVEAQAAYVEPARVISPDALASEFGRGEVTLPPPPAPVFPSAVIDVTTPPRPESAGDAPERAPSMGQISIKVADFEIARVVDPSDLWSLAGPLSALRRVCLGGEGDALSIEGAGLTPQELEEMQAARPCARVAGGFTEGLTAVSNMWFATEADLRVYFAAEAEEAEADGRVLRVFQASSSAPAQFTQIASEALSGHAPWFFDVPLNDPLMPLVFEVSNAMGITQELAVIPFPSLLDGGLHSAERVAFQRAKTGIEEVWRVTDGLLFELSEVSEKVKPTVSAIKVQLAGATGSEPIFRPHVRAWLASLFGLSVRALAEDAPDIGQQSLTDQLSSNDGLSAYAKARAGRRVSSGHELHLAANAVPSLGALVSVRLRVPEGQGALTGSFVVADAVSKRSRWVVSLPANAPDVWSELQGLAPVAPRLQAAPDAVKTPLSAPYATTPIPLAIAFAQPEAGHDAQLLYPRAPDAPGSLFGAASPQMAHATDLLIDLRSDADPTQMLEAAAAQTDIAWQTVTFATAHTLSPELQAAYASVLGDHVREVIFSTEPLKGLLDQAAGTSPYVMALAPDIILHDVRSVSALHDIAATDTTIAAVGCAVVQEQMFKKQTAIRVASAGVFPMGLSLSSGPGLTFAEPDATNALPNSVYPVVAANLRAALVRREAITATRQRRADLGAFDAEDIQFGLDAHVEGYTSFAATAVPVLTTKAARPRDEIDPLGLAYLGAVDWAALLSKVTVLRELRG
ncbi:MAG: hypothetical protein AAFQ36_11620 [Pseudomonadota bacterium]